jgi:methyl-accepting chemotaxis protein
MNWFNGLRFRSKLSAGFLLVAMIAGVVGGIGILFIKKIDAQDDKLYEKITVPLGDLANMAVAYQRVRINLRDAVESKDATELRQYRENIKNLRQTIAERADKFEKTILTEEGRKIFKEFRDARNVYGDYINKVLELEEAKKGAEALALLHGDAQKAALREQDLLDKLLESKEAQAKLVSEDNKLIAGHATYYMIAFAMFGVFMAIALGQLVAKVIQGQLGGDPTDVAEIAQEVAAGNLAVKIDMVGKRSDSLISAMSRMVDNLRDLVSQTVEISSGIAAASNQLHSTAEQISTGAEKVASQAGTVAASSEEMSNTSSDIARNCTVAAVASNKTTDAANAGSKVVNETISGMNIIADRVRNTSKTIEALGARSEEIGDIVGTIEDIADQTNLLALNAAIEAARAGEQGRGFAVVADEVRALAERTTKATREIGEMIKAIQSETRAAVQTMEEGVHEVEKGAQSSQQSGRALQNILDCINEVTMQINQIATASEEQTATTNEVTMNIQQINDVVTQTARGAEETASAAGQLSTQAQTLQNLINRFRLA